MERVHTLRDGQRQICEEWGPATEYSVCFVLTVLRNFTALSTEVKNISNEFECWRPGERYAIDDKRSPSAVHRVGPESFFVKRNLETDFPKLDTTFTDHLGESQPSPCKDQKIIGISQTRHP